MSEDSKEANPFFIGLMLYIFLMFIIYLYEGTRSPTGRGISRNIKKVNKDEYSNNESEKYYRWLNGPQNDIDCSVIG